MAHIKQMFLDIIESGGEPPIVYEGPYHQKAEFTQTEGESDTE